MIIVVRLQAGRGRKHDSIAGMRRQIFSHSDIQSGPRSHPTSYSVGTGDSST